MWKFGVNSDPQLYTQYNFFNFLMLSIEEGGEWFMDGGKILSEDKSFLFWKWKENTVMPNQ